MNNFEWEYLEDNISDHIDNITNYTDSMINNNEYEEDYYDTEDSKLDNWNNYYYNIANEIIEEIDY
jgi:hypothetical protein